MGSRQLSKEQINEIVDEYEKGVGAEMLAQYYDSTRTMIVAVLKEAGVYQPRVRTTLSLGELELEIVRLRLEGWAVSRIARKLYTRTTTVSEVLIRNQLHTKLVRGENSSARKKLTGQVLAQVISEYNAGASMAELSQKYNTAQLTVSRALRKSGVKIRTVGGQYDSRLRSPEATTFLKWLHSEGWDRRAMAKFLECHENTVRGLCFRLGLDAQVAGPGHHNWKGGRIATPQGYIRIRVDPTDPLILMADNSRYVLEHRLVIARHLGRPLRDNETVHHIDGDRSNNTLSNLQLRLGNHGAAQAYCCGECGSINIVPVPLK